MKYPTLSSAIIALLPVLFNSATAETVPPCTVLTSMQSQIAACATGRGFCNSYLGTTRRLTRTAYETANVPGSTTTVASSTSTVTNFETELADPSTSTSTTYSATTTIYRENCPEPLKVRAAPPGPSASCGFKRKETNQWNLHAACQCVLAPITTSTRTSSGTVTSISTLHLTTTTMTVTSTPTVTTTTTVGTATCTTPPPCNSPYTCGGSPSFCSTNCICIGRVDGTPSAECVDLASLGACTDFRPCTSNAGCPADHFCATSGCCNTPLCFPTSGCPNPASRHRLFKIRSPPKTKAGEASGPTYLGEYDNLRTGERA